MYGVYEIPQKETEVKNTIIIKRNYTNYKNYIYVISKWRSITKTVILKCSMLGESLGIKVMRSLIGLRVIRIKRCDVGHSE